jgi:hypothetical protein
MVSLLIVSVLLTGISPMGNVGFINLSDSQFTNIHLMCEAEYCEIAVRVKGESGVVLIKEEDTSQVNALKQLVSRLVPKNGKVMGRISTDPNRTQLGCLVVAGVKVKDGYIFKQIDDPDDIREIVGLLSEVLERWRGVLRVQALDLPERLIVVE